MVLVTNGRLITRDSEGKGYYEHGAVAYEGAKIVEVGEESALRRGTGCGILALLKKGMNENDTQWRCGT